MYSDYTSASNDWYQKTIVVVHNYLNNRLADIQLGRLRFWAYTRNLIGPSPATICRHCQQVYDPVCYLLNCPAYPKHRIILKGHLRPDDYQLPDHHRAASLIRKSTFLPDTITRSDRPYGLVSKNVGLSYPWFGRPEVRIPAVTL